MGGRVCDRVYEKMYYHAASRHVTTDLCPTALVVFSEA